MLASTDDAIVGDITYLINFSMWNVENYGLWLIGEL
jgi:hypothetical protein